MGCGHSKIGLTYHRKQKRKCNNKRGGKLSQDPDDVANSVDNNTKNSLLDEEKSKKLANKMKPLSLSTGPLLQQAEISTSQLDFFKMLDEKIENGEDYDSDQDRKDRKDRIHVLLREWEEIVSRPSSQHNMLPLSANPEDIANQEVPISSHKDRKERSVSCVQDSKNSSDSSSKFGPTLNHAASVQLNGSIQSSGAVPSSCGVEPFRTTHNSTGKQKGVTRRNVAKSDPASNSEHIKGNSDRTGKSRNKNSNPGLIDGSDCRLSPSNSSIVSSTRTSSASTAGRGNRSPSVMSERGSAFSMAHSEQQCMSSVSSASNDCEKNCSTESEHVRERPRSIELQKVLAEPESFNTSLMNATNPSNTVTEFV